MMIWIKIKNFFKRLWKWILSLFGVGIVALALTNVGEVRPITYQHNCTGQAISAEETIKTVTPDKVYQLNTTEGVKEINYDLAVASIKGCEIAKRGIASRQTVNFSGHEYEIELVQVKALVGGVEVLAKAWKGGKQIGFGEKGDVEIERFIMGNPPVLVRDPNGTIERTYNFDKTETIKYREDPTLATMQIVSHAIHVNPQARVSGNIKAGKVGTTTYTANPAAGNAAPIDGRTRRAVATETFATIRAGAGTGVQPTDAGERTCDLSASTTTDQYDRLSRGLHGFATSSGASNIPDNESISSATISFYGGGTNANEFGMSVVIDRGVPANANALVNADHNLARWNGLEQSITRILLGDWSTVGYNDFTLNNRGINNIQKSFPLPATPNNTANYTWLGTRCSADFDNIEPTWGSGLTGEVFHFYADQTGTSQDPLLTVVGGRARRLNVISD